MSVLIDQGFLRWVRRWLWAASGACLIAPLLLLQLGDDWIRTIAMLPMANCLVVWLLLAFALRKPLGELSVARHEHLANSASDSATRRANETFASLKPALALFVWPFLLIPLSWLVLLAVKS